MVLGQLGAASVLLALGLTLYAFVGGMTGALRGDIRLQTSARHAAVAIFLALTAAVMIMETALLTDDFSVKYVADTSSTASPLWVKIVTLWAALEGSILLWAWILSGYTALLALVALDSPLRAWGLTVMKGVQLFFIGVISTVANPFAVLASPPLDGPGPNPLLQNHWMMAVHPVLMYLGFVGLTVPFAYAISALITRRPGTEWIYQTRTWTLIGWGFLGVANIAGAWWSYEVLGWGGYWAWDPVENVAFLPWLTATAFIHSVQVQERRRMLKSWNIFLIVLTFSLSIFGTFIIRSGVLSSVHAFGDGPVGPAFLGFFILVLLISLSLVALRWDQLRDHAELDAPISREGSFLLGNVLFLAMAFAILLGTLFPLVVEALTGDKVTVGTPFFDQVTLPLWMLILALMGIGPLLPWRKAEHQSLMRSVLYLTAGGAVAAVLAYAFGVRKVYPLLIIALAGYNLVSLGLLMGGAVTARMRATGQGAVRVFSQYALDSRRRFGSMIVHFAVVVIAVAIAGSSSYRTDTQFRLTLYEPVIFAGYQLTAREVFTENLPQRQSRGAAVEVRREGRLLTTLRPRINQFRNSEQSVTTPGVMYTPFEDIYLSLNQIGEGGEFIVIRAVRSPLVTWIWIGGFILALGTLYALLPPRRRTAVHQRGAVSA